MDMLTSNEMLDNVQMYDSTVEIVGYVDGIDAPRYVGDKSQYKVFKLYLNNGSGKRVQIVAWNDDIDVVEQYIISNQIVHLDGVQARPPKRSNFNNGYVPFELQIRSNIVITSLGKYDLENTLNVEPEHIEFLDVMNTVQRVVVEGYIKTNFTSVHHNLLDKMIGCGSITDGEFKLEVHIMNFNEEEYYNLRKGDKVKVNGIMQSTDHRLNFDHEFDWENIQILDNERYLSRRLVSEMTHIKLQKNGINSQNDTEFLHHAYIAVLNKL
ncbi:uncharacterized protein [Temnothorax nylanderi]|uniref:uncharacterized protein n=1 Tax=Temnothorax nylanderi TaxID=102681 RepID=UPI003A84F6CC